ncbi:hypothetical protein V8B97DRAFT_1972424 [Scleroderma yunnanense]
MNSSTSSVSRVCSVVGQWQRTSSTVASADNIDLEAQLVTGTHAPITLPALPLPARPAAEPTRTPEHDTSVSDPIDDFFGVTCPRATQESRHDAVSYPSLSSRISACLDGDTPPPPYYQTSVDGNELPAYTVAPHEPSTLAMYLFKFGFLFPPFWIMGALILLSPLNPPADFEPTKSEAERRELVELIRKTELRWAKRSAWALLILIISLGIICGIVVAAMKSNP